jgi:hypothetical protein
MRAGEAPRTGNRVPLRRLPDQLQREIAVDLPRAIGRQIGASNQRRLQGLGVTSTYGAGDVTLGVGARSADITQ